MGEKASKSKKNKDTSQTATTSDTMPTVRVSENVSETSGEHRVSENNNNDTAAWPQQQQDLDVSNSSQSVTLQQNENPNESRGKRKKSTRKSKESNPTKSPEFQKIEQDQGSEEENPRSDKKPEEGTEETTEDPLLTKPNLGAEGSDKLKILRNKETPPSVVFAFPLKESSLFPDMTVPVLVSSPSLKELLSQEEQQRQFVAFFCQNNDVEVPEPDDLYKVGVVARVLRATTTPDGFSALVIQVTHRCRMERVVLFQPHKKIVRIEVLQDQVNPEDHVIIEALMRNVRQLLEDIARLSANVSEEFVFLIRQLDNPSNLADFVALQFLHTIAERQPFLEALDVRKRLEMALVVLLKESEMLKLQTQLRDEIHSQMEQRQREYMLREQLKLIRHELGEEVGEKELDVEKYEIRIQEAKMPEEAEKKTRAELRRLAVLPPEAAEYNIIRTYLDWLCDLPWSKRSEDRIDLRRAQWILNRDHYGLERVKERILEFLAVHKLKSNQKGAILCLSGPPGVGKTSLGRSIAEAMGREFFRFSVGGMHDEAEIKGHRRTYIGAMPGKILQALRRVQTRNPVLMLDEIDKIGKDWRGDPASALLEVLDPAQNQNFLDHYLDVNFDLSEVMFITTANYRDAIPVPLLDRMEVIELAGYIPEEKVEIARRYLLPRQREAHGLEKEQLHISHNAMSLIIDRYTRESGVRELERQISAICRKVATRAARASRKEKTVRVRVQETNLVQFLGQPRYVREDVHQRKPRPGRVTGMAWTPVGGETLVFEATLFPGTGKLELTGKMGEVMTESSRLALSFLKSHAGSFSIDLEKLAKTDLHLHAPAGAVPKDGPSAGIAITTAFLSLLATTPLNVPPDIAMTGEITLLGDLLPVGGIREKVVAAASAGIPTVILPAQNRKDLEEVPAYIRDKIDFHFADHYQDVAQLLFPGVFHPAQP